MLLGSDFVINIGTILYFVFEHHIIKSDPEIK